MTRIWESSVVIGLRDLQWKHARPHAQFPDEYVSLDGNAERALGDGLLALEERYFIIEAKSTSNEICEEWTGLSGRKRALLALDSALSAFRNQVAEDNLKRSLQGHFFAYWPITRMVYTSAHGSILMEPYLAGVQRNKGFKGAADTLSKRLTGTMGLGASWAHKDMWREVAIDVTRYNAASADQVLTGKVKFVAEDGDKLLWDHLGLPLEDFQQYVDFLVKNSGKAGQAQEPICAVIMSTTGSFFAHITNTSQLSKIFQPHSDGMERVDGKGRPIKRAEFKKLCPPILAKKPGM